MSKSLVEKIEHADVPKSWVIEVKHMLKHIMENRVELKTRIEIIDALAIEREDLVKVLINTVNALDRAWSDDDVQYNTNSLNKIIRHLDTVLVRLENDNGPKRTE